MYASNVCVCLCVCVCVCVGVVDRQEALPHWTSGCAAQVRALHAHTDGSQVRVLSARDSGQGGQGADGYEGDGGAGKSGKRFVYLGTGETEENFNYRLALVSPDADAIFCVWGQGPEGEAARDEQGKTCVQECTGDARRVCRQVCRSSLHALPPASAARHGQGRVNYIYVPRSSFQQGRNHLYLEALRSGEYAYFIFLVDDVSLIHMDWDTGLMAANPFRTFEQYLIAWQPAVGVPGAARRDDDHNIDPRHEVSSIYGFDHLMMAVHRDAADALLPYSLEHEDESWWYSEYILNLAAAGLFGPHHVLQFQAVFAETYRAGYVGYPHASDFSVPLRWMLPAFRRHEQLRRLHVHEYTCLSPTDPLADARPRPHYLSYAHIWKGERGAECCNACHPYFLYVSSRRSKLQEQQSDTQSCGPVRLEVAAALLSLLQLEQEHNGTVCEWCLLHPRSPQTSNCANRLNGVELPLLVRQTNQGIGRVLSVEQQLRLELDAAGNPL